MNRLEEVYEMTLKLNTILTNVTAENRESLIQEINELIDKREQALKLVKSPYTLDEKVIGQKLLSLNKTVQKQLDQVFTKLKQEMEQMQQQKKSNRSYINPYGEIKTIDGVYIDSKQ